MLKWEIKKILKDKSSIITLLLMILLFIQISFMKPMLETQHEYVNEKTNEYVVDNRSKDVIANENLKQKVNSIKLMSDLSYNNNKSLIDISKEKLSLDKGSKYEKVDFYKVWIYRLDFSLSIMIMLIIIVMLVSNSYTDEVVSNTSPIILSSKEKNKVLYSKIGLSILIPVLMYGLYIGGTWLITYMQYGAPLNENLQAYRICDVAVLAKAITINQFALIKILTTSLMLIGISTVSMLISFLSDNSVKSIGLTVGFVVLGKVLTVFKFLPKFVIGLLSANYIDVITGMCQISGVYNGNIYILSKSVDVSNLSISMYGLIVVFGILGSTYTIKKVLTK
ncbi:hypothetical protein [Terrisporobacter mayombei]|uniref:ABC transporter permease n=1 Tax=Terrisporobacter mayombei TaxID=1541 RepID=A0ABY9Q6Y7_9FIRM|nr:hypothetical protein [Terrisporobacter mayombei]MCC3868872.1 hypothetical protein [Terrisporobacter mayombei]WMT82995.1 hypothetical protein TEMA_34930 [Terrisporobacter mayombei]